ncbi:MAG TPA: class I SAM-dependent methyltransferase [Streptosporangiaceae bacterium]|nr:class I SAM-dependent methyltransferase [Streptosporangiaceae bacterium]
MIQQAQPDSPGGSPQASASGRRAMDGVRTRGFTQPTIPAGYAKYLLGQLFEPWARDMIGRGAPRQGEAVLDLATGLGPVARLAAAIVGASGRVVASDISPAMLAVAAARPVDPDWAPIEYLECPASAIDTADDSFDVAYCSHGLEFFAERETALSEIYRVVRPGGMALMSVWAAEHPVGLFSQLGQTMREIGLSQPYSRAYDADSYRMSGPELQRMVQAAGFCDVKVEMVELEGHWDNPDDAANTVQGTPFGPLVAAMPAEDQQRMRKILLSKLGGSAGGVTVRSISNVVIGTKQR